MKRFLLIFLMQFVSQIYSQNIFDEKYDGCNTDYFVMESNKISVKMKSDIVRIFLNDFDKETVNNIRGVLALQIIVDTIGKSCLLSVKNYTNIKTNKLNLKKIVDRELIWEKPKKNVGIILAVKFYGDSIQIKRVGFTKEKGFNELKN